MPADLPALTQLTDDVIAAMHAAERREHRRHASRTRRRLGLLTVLTALLVPSGLALHASDAQSAPLPSPDHAAAFATAAGTVTAGAVVAVASARAITHTDAGLTGASSLRRPA
jgi:hypothetical protein